MKIKLVKFIDGLDSTDFLTLGNVYEVVEKGSCKGSLRILDDEQETCEIFEEEYEVVE